MSDDTVHGLPRPETTEAPGPGSAPAPVPASIVPVMAWAGETEDEALKRYGIDHDRPGAEIVFLHLN
jgi:hypothetical protein